jgi:hypothetical protein
MINQSTVEAALLKWMENFVEQPHPSLGGWSPCPYARQARLSNNISIIPGQSPYADCLSLLDNEWQQEVIIFWYSEINAEDFIRSVTQANKILLPKNIVALEDHPAIDEVVNGVKMNFEFCAIIVCQQLDKLTAASEQLKAKRYYDSWNSDELDNVVTWRHP